MHFSKDSFFLHACCFYGVMLLIRWWLSLRITFLFHPFFSWYLGILLPTGDAMHDTAVTRKGRCVRGASEMGGSSKRIPVERRQPTMLPVQGKERNRPSVTVRARREGAFAYKYALGRRTLPLCASTCWMLDVAGSTVFPSRGGNTIQPVVARRYQGQLVVFLLV